MGRHDDPDTTPPGPRRPTTTPSRGEVARCTTTSAAPRQDHADAHAEALAAVGAKSMIKGEVQVVITTPAYRDGQAAAWDDFDRDSDRTQ